VEQANRLMLPQSLAHPPMNCK